MALDREFYTILVVDDDEDMRRMMGELIHLYESSIQVLFAEDGETALGVLRDHSPDLMLLDVVMPEMSGWEVLPLKQQDPDTQAIPVIMVSADDLQKSPFTTLFILASFGDGVSIGKQSDCLSFFPKLMVRSN